MAWVELAYSKSQVKRAGKVLRDSVRHPLTIGEQTVRDAELALENWRSAHAFALNSVQMTLRRQVERAQLTADVSQRLKERRTIIDKLLREPTMQLSTMQDIAGCRAVVPDLAAVRQVVGGWHDARLRKLEVVEEYDYLAAVELGQPIDASLRSEAHDFLTMLQAEPPAPEGDHDD